MMGFTQVYARQGPSTEKDMISHPQARSYFQLPTASKGSRPILDLYYFSCFYDIILNKDLFGSQFKKGTTSLQQESLRQLVTLHLPSGCRAQTGDDIWP